MTSVTPSAASPRRPALAGIRAAHIETLRLLPERLRAAVDGLSDAQLDTPYREGGWTVRQLVHHVADSHANCLCRASSSRSLKIGPPSSPTTKPPGPTWPTAGCLSTSRSSSSTRSMQRWVALLESLRDDGLPRGYIHPERGRQNLATALALYDWHSRHHTAHITALRARQGW